MGFGNAIAIHNDPHLAFKGLEFIPLTGRILKYTAERVAYIASF